MPTDAKFQRRHADRRRSLQRGLTELERLSGAVEVLTTLRETLTVLAPMLDDPLVRQGLQALHDLATSLAPLDNVRPAQSSDSPGAG